MQMICLPRRGRRGLNFPLLQARHTAPIINYELRLKMHCIRKMRGWWWVVSLSYVMRVHLGTADDENVCEDQARGFPSDI